MKRNKLKVLTKIIAVLIICLISFVGIYVQNANRMENKITQTADYKFSKDLKGYRQVIFEVEKDKDKADEEISEEEFENAKKMIEYRLNSFKVKKYNSMVSEQLAKDYNISVDRENGTIALQLTENDYTDRIVSNIKEKGGVEFKDTDADKVFVDSSNLESSEIKTINTESGVIVFVEMKFNKDGIEKLKELTSEEYATVEKSEDEADEKSEESEESDKEDSKTKKLTLAISGSEVLSETFENFKKNNMIEIDRGIIRFSVSQSGSINDSDINDYLLSASILSTLVEKEPLSLSYTVTENQYVKSEIFDVTMLVAIGITIAIMVVISIYMIAKFKVRGLLSAISSVGFFALYLLLIRFTNVEISLEGIVSIILVVILNYIFSIKLLKTNNDAKEYKKQYKEGILKMVPIFAISIIVSLINWAVLNSFGMCMIWGIWLILIYNVLVTKKIVD